VQVVTWQEMRYLRWISGHFNCQVECALKTCIPHQKLKAFNLELIQPRSWLYQTAHTLTRMSAYLICAGICITTLDITFSVT